MQQARAGTCTTEKELAVIIYLAIELQPQLQLQEEINSLRKSFNYVTGHMWMTLLRNHSCMNFNYEVHMQTVTV